MFHVLRLVMGRIIWFPIAFVLAHFCVFMWKALDPNYKVYARWVADHVFANLHPAEVWLVNQFFPALSVYVSNSEPSPEDAPKFFYTLFFSIISVAGLVSSRSSGVLGKSKDK